MALMSGLPIVPVAPTKFAREAPRFYESRSLSFRGLNGDDLLDWGETDDGVRALICRQGMTGLDFVPRDLIRSKRAGMAGSILREVQVGEREVFLPLFISGSNHGEYLSRRDEVAGMLDDTGVDYQGNDGTFDLVASSERSVRTLRCMYSSGLEGDYAPDVMGNWWESFGLTQLAVQPYWVGGEWSTPVVRLPAGGAWFGQFPHYLSSSRVIGANMPVVVDGDKPSWAQVDVVGPADSVTITAPGLSVTVSDGLASGEFFHLSTDIRDRVAEFNGVSDWSRVGANDAYKQLAPGDSHITITVPGATVLTNARVYGPALFGRAW